MWGNVQCTKHNKKTVNGQNILASLCFFSALCSQLTLWKRICLLDYSSRIVISRKLLFHMAVVINDYSICLMTSLLFFLTFLWQQLLHCFSILIGDSNCKGCNLLLITVLCHMNDYTLSRCTVPWQGRAATACLKLGGGEGTEMLA